MKCVLVLDLSLINVSQFLNFFYSTRFILHCFLNLHNIYCTYSTYKVHKKSHELYKNWDFVQNTRIVTVPKQIQYNIKIDPHFWNFFTYCR